MFVEDSIDFKEVKDLTLDAERKDPNPASSFYTNHPLPHHHSTFAAVNSLSR